jgi:hypothetical protein
MNMKVNRTVDRFDDKKKYYKSTVDNGERNSGERGEEDGNGRGSRTRGADGQGKLLPLSNSGVQFLCIFLTLFV